MSNTPEASKVDLVLNVLECLTNLSRWNADVVAGREGLLFEAHEVTLGALADLIPTDPAELANALAQVSAAFDPVEHGISLDMGDDDGLIVPSPLLPHPDAGEDGALALRLSGDEARSLLGALEDAGIPHETLRAVLWGLLQDGSGEDGLDAARGTSPDIARLIEEGHPTPLVIRRAIGCHAELLVHYVDSMGTSTSRIIRPIALVIGADGELALRAWCHMRKEERTFVVANLTVVACHGLAGDGRDQDEDDVRGTCLVHLIVPDKTRVSEAYDWHGMRYLDQDEAGIWLTRDQVDSGYGVAVIPWVKGTAWLPRMLLVAGGDLWVSPDDDAYQELCDLVIGIARGLSDHPAIAR